MFIQTEPTPNPATLKFLPGQTVLATGALEYRSKESAAKAPLAEALLSIAGVEIGDVRAGTSSPSPKRTLNGRI